jgi:site-specific DNA recombinase
MTKELARLEATQRQLELQMDRLLDAYQRGAMSIEQLKARRERLDAAMTAACVRADELATQKVDSARVARIANDLAAFAATLRDGIDALDFADRQRLVRLLLERVVVTGDNLTIEHAIPLSGRFGGLRQGSRRRLPALEGRAVGA